MANSLSIPSSNSVTVTVADGADIALGATTDAGALTFGTNVITITNGSTLTWSGLAWGT